MELASSSSLHAPTRKDIAFLVVDDDPLIVQLIAGAVRPLGKVGFVQDFSSTMISILENHPKVVFLDVDLPGKTGIEISREIRSEPELDDVYVVMITSHDTAAVQSMIAHSHADEALQKPLDPVAIGEMAKSLLAKKRVFA